MEPRDRCVTEQHERMTEGFKSREVQSALFVLIGKEKEMIRTCDTVREIQLDCTPL